MPQINPKNLRVLRLQKGWNLSKLAEESKVERGTISRIENAKRADQRNHTIQRLAAALGITAEILTGPDIDQPQKEVEAAKSQMNLRLSNDMRNALNLIAMRYGIKPNHIVQAAPLLFLWAAEESLKKRRQNLDELFAAWDAAEKIGGFRHLSGDLTHHYRGEDIAREEEKSISKKDILGLLIDREAQFELPADEDEDELNPMSRFIADLVEPLGDLADFRYWSPYSGPQFTIGRDEAAALVNGDADAAEAIVNGVAPLHELPRNIRDSGPEKIALWAKNLAEEDRRNFEILLGKIDLRKVQIAGAAK